MIGGPTQLASTLTLLALLLFLLSDFWAVKSQGAPKAPTIKDNATFQIIRVAQSVGISVGAAAPWLFPRYDLPFPTWLPVTLGLSLVLAGSILRVWSVLSLGQMFRRVLATAPTDRLVTDGPYRLLRHPSYTGVLIALLGLSLAFDNVLALGAFLMPMLAYVYRLTKEEEILVATFGHEYRAYQRQSWRLLPFIW